MPEEGAPLQREFPDYFADADADYGDARFVILGAPYDATVSYRAGTAGGPRAIRQAAWNFETFNLRNRVDISEVPFHDMGDVEVAGLAPEKMVAAVRDAAGRVAGDGKVPILLGGEHSVSPPVVDALADAHDNLAVLQLDAHLDYRAEYEESPHSHACAARRAADAVGAENVVVFGVRSAERAEVEAAQRDGLRFFSTWDIKRLGVSRALDAALDHLAGADALYLTLDIDGLDPAHAPGTGTPEPYGLAPEDVLAAITRTADRLVGFDVVEVSPPWDNGNTAALAARLVREAITEVWDKQVNAW